MISLFHILILQRFHKKFLKLERVAIRVSDAMVYMHTLDKKGGNVRRKEDNLLMSPSFDFFSLFCKRHMSTSVAVKFHPDTAANTGLV